MIPATTSLRLSQRLSPSASVSMRTLNDITLHHTQAAAARLMLTSVLVPNIDDAAGEKSAS
jgi:hypothetical protein